MNNILTTEISINSIGLFLYTNLWVNPNCWVVTPLLLVIYYFGGILLRNLLAHAFKKAYEDENNKPKTYFTNDEKQIFMLSRVFFPIALVIAIFSYIVVTCFEKQDKYLDKILKKMKLYIKEFYKENTFLGLKSGTLLCLNIDHTLLRLIFQNNQWSIETIKGNPLNPLLSNLTKINCQIKDNRLVIRIGYKFWKYKIYEAVS